MDENANTSPEADQDTCADVAVNPQESDEEEITNRPHTTSESVNTEVLGPGIPWEDKTEEEKLNYEIALDEDARLNKPIQMQISDDDTSDSTYFSEEIVYVISGTETDYDYGEAVIEDDGTLKITPRVPIERTPLPPCHVYGDESLYEIVSD